MINELEGVNHMQLQSQGTGIGSQERVDLLSQCCSLILGVYSRERERGKSSKSQMQYHHRVFSTCYVTGDEDTDSTGQRHVIQLQTTFQDVQHLALLCGMEVFCSH